MMLEPHSRSGGTFAITAGDGDGTGDATGMFPLRVMDQATIPTLASSTNPATAPIRSRRRPSFMLLRTGNSKPLHSEQNASAPDVIGWSVLDFAKLQSPPKFAQRP
jgi:hypothetical protein